MIPAFVIAWRVFRFVFRFRRYPVRVELTVAMKPDGQPPAKDWRGWDDGADQIEKWRKQMES